MTEGNPNPRWGGKREGAGRKKQARLYSDTIKRRLMTLLRRDAKENGGEDWLADLVKMQRNEKIQDAVRLGCKKLISEILVVRESHRTEEVQYYGPVILPKLDDDPAKLDFSKLPEELRKREGMR